MLGYTLGQYQYLKDTTLFSDYYTILMMIFACLGAIMGGYLVFVIKYLQTSKGRLTVCFTVPLVIIFYSLTILIFCQIFDTKYLFLTFFTKSFQGLTLGAISALVPLFCMIYQKYSERNISYKDCGFYSEFLSNSCIILNNIDKSWFTYFLYNWLFWKKFSQSTLLKNNLSISINSSDWSDFTSSSNI